MINLSLACLGVLFVVCSILIFCSHYEDGILGRVALAIMAVISFAVLYDTAQGYSWQPSEATVTLLAGMALFMARHFYRFLRFTYGGRVGFGWKQQVDRNDQ